MFQEYPIFTHFLLPQRYAFGLILNPKPLVINNKQLA